VLQFIENSAPAIGCRFYAEFRVFVFLPTDYVGIFYLFILIFIILAPILLSRDSFLNYVGEVKFMFNSLRKIFCLHVYEYSWDHKHGYVQECRKCGKND
jgi:hypothetical protein